MLDILKKVLLVLALSVFISGIGFTFWLRDRFAVPVITYHHVGTPSGTKYRLNVVSLGAFEYQMSFLKRHGFNVISFYDFIQGVKENQLFSRNTVVIQFDDGYEDNYTYAFPVLKRYDFPATIFLVSDWVGKPGFLTWDEIKEMEQNGITFGAHTRHHVYLPLADDVTAADEIAGSKQIIEEHLGRRIDFLSYPSGGFTSDIKHLVKKAGFKAAVTTNRGKYVLNEDLYELKRIHMSQADSRHSGISMWAKLSGYYNLFRDRKDGGELDKRKLSE